MPTDPGRGPGGYLAPRLSGSPAWTPLLELAVPVCVYRVDGTVLLTNQALLDLHGYPLAKILEQGWVPLTQPGTAARERMYGLNGLRISGGGTMQVRRWGRFADGRDHLVEVITTRVRLPDGEPVLMSLLYEVPAPQAADGAAVAVADRGYRELVEDALEAFLRLDPASGRVLLVSAAIERLTGWAPSEFYADPGLLSRCVDPASRAAWEHALTLVRHGEACSLDLSVIARGERKAILALSLHPICDADGTVRLLEGSARDITVERQAEALRGANQQRLLLDGLKSELLANVSHELRTPLVSIRGYNELLVRGALGPLTPRQTRALEVAGANIDRLIELIETLLDFTRREEGRLQLRSARLDLRHAATDAMADLHERIASRNLTPRVDLGELPLEVVGDRARLTQVFRALIANAEKFSESSGGEIRLTGSSDGRTASVAVADRGIGIPKEAHTKIFDRFYQVDASPTRRFGGAGLGLALAKEIVTLHGGEITVDSVEGGGSTFTVRLPLAEMLERPMEPPPERPVVLVGADAPTWQRLRRLLDDEGALGPIDLMRGESQADVLRRARRHRPDVVVVAFPGADGTVDVLKSDPEIVKVPVVVVTSELRRPIGRADLIADVDDSERLIAGMARLLGRERADSERAARVVIVDDEIEILDFCRFVLEREGYQVVCLQGRSAELSSLVGESDLLIIDIALEDADGLDVCRELRRQPATRGVPILVMTAMSGESVRQGSLGAGADGYLLKPFGVDEFLRQVRLQLKRAPGLRDGKSA